MAFLEIVFNCYKNVTKVRRGNMKAYDSNSYKRSLLTKEPMIKAITLIAIYAMCIYMLNEILYDGGRGKTVLTADTKPVFSEYSVRSCKFMDSYELPCEYVNDSEMYVGERCVVQKREPGIKEYTVMITIDGDEEKREQIDCSIVKEAVPEIVHIGTKEKPQYIVPVSGYRLTSTFGPRWGTNHNGIDLGVVTGTKVLASADGEVIQSGWNGGYGISVYIKHADGSITRYGHLSKNIAAKGSFVSQGDVIGLSGNTGDSTGPHLHFEIRIDGQAVDPLSYISLN